MNELVDDEFDGKLKVGFLPIKALQKASAARRESVNNAFLLNAFLLFGNQVL